MATITRFLDRPGGRLSYDDSGGDGQLIIAAPGMGDVRASHRHLRPLLVDAGLRVATMDLRGMGESSAEWDDLADAAVASDYLALVEELDAGPAILIGNSLSCASAVIAATDAPDKVAAIVLIGPFVRVVPMKWWQKAAFGAMLAPPWGRSMWVNYYAKNLYPGAKPPDHDEYIDALKANLSEPGRFAAFRRITGNSHAESGKRLSSVTQPSVVIMGTADPDFPDPIAEANEITEILGGELVLVDGSGHYPQADSPEVVAPAVIDLAKRVHPS